MLGTLKAVAREGVRGSVTLELATEIPVLAAVAQASVEHDAWLASIGTWYVDGVNENPHPHLGWGAPAGEVAQVLFHGKTTHAARRDAMLERGLRSMMEVEPWSLYERVREEIWSECKEFQETDSERSRAVAQLLRAERLGLVERHRTHRNGGTTYWALAA